MLHAAVLAAALVFQGVVVVRHASGVEEPVYGALVTIDEAAAITLPDGSFEINHVPPGTHIISVNANARSMHGQIEIPRRAQPRKLILLDPTCWAIQGKVRDARSARPIAGAQVDYLGTAATDGDGDYFIDLGCSSEPGFRFHNSFYYSVAAPRFEPLLQFGGRAEFVSGVILQDFSLVPIERQR